MIDLKKIRVGDILEDENGTLCAVLRVSNVSFWVVWPDGSCGEETDMQYYKKTADHVNLVEKLLKCLGGIG